MVVEPERDPNSGRGYYLDQEYEARVREQHKAINKAIPHWVAHELKRKITSQAEADRVTSKYCTHLEQRAKEMNIKTFPLKVSLVCAQKSKSAGKGHLTKRYKF